MRRSTLGPVVCTAWPATCATESMGPGFRTQEPCAASDARLRQPSPLDLEAIRGRILLDEERGTAEDPQGDGFGPLHAVREFVLHLISVDLHPREVRVGELHLVQVHEGEALRPGPLDQADEVRLPLWNQGDLDPDREAEGPRETRGSHEGAVRGAGPEARRDVESDLVEARPCEGTDLVGIRRHRIQVGVERRTELRLQEADVPARPFDRVEGVASRNPRAGGADGPGLLEDVLVPRDALLVREDDVLIHLLVRDGAVETMEGTDARDEEDHLGPVRALPASDREAAAGESSEGPLLEAHGSTNRRRGINIPHHEGGGANQRPQEENVPLSGGMSRLNEAFDPGPPPGEFLLRVPVVDGHPAQEIGPGGLRVRATDVVLLPLRPSVRPLVMPEVEVPPSVEVTNTSAASDLHFIPLSRGMPQRAFSVSGGGMRKCREGAS